MLTARYLKLCFLITILTFICKVSHAQNNHLNEPTNRVDKIVAELDELKPNHDSVTILTKELLRYSNNNHNKKGRALAYFYLGGYQFFTGQADSAGINLEIARDSMLVYCNDSLKLGKVYSYIATLVENQWQFDSARENYLLAYTYVPTTVDSVWNVFVCERIAHSSFMFGEYYTSLAYYQDCIVKYKNLKSPNKNKNLARIYNNLGLIYRNIEETQKEEEAYLKSIEFLEGRYDDVSLGMAYNNLGTIYLDENNDSLGLYFLEQAKAIYDSTDYIRGMAGYHSSLFSYFLDKDPVNWDTIKYHAKESFEISKASNDYRMMADAGAYYAEALIELGDLKLAEKILLESLQVAKEGQQTREYSKVLRYLSYLYKKTNKTDKALEYLEESYTLKDSLISDEKLKDIIKLDQRFKYEQERLQDSIAQVAKAQELEFDYTEKLQKQKLSNLIIVFILLLMAIVAFFIFKSLRRSRAHVKELEEKNKIIQEAMAAKSAFFSRMSHELRSPLNSIIGISNLMINNNTDPNQKENLDALSFSSNNLFMLINDILDYSKIEAGKMTFDSVQVNLPNLLENIVRIHKPSINPNKVDFSLKLEGEFPPLILDPTRISQVLNNLLSNSVKFTESGFIELLVRKESETDSECTLYFQVKDSGIGIPPESMNDIFSSFSPSTKSVTNDFGGTGLGLAITKSILDLKGAEIKVDSTVGKGSTFYFYLTLPKGNEREGEIEKGIDNSTFDGPEILLVEDNPINVLVTTQFLKKWNINYQVAENGQMAVEMVKENPFKLVLMDCMMPILDGYEATKQIRTFNPTIPIIALTASAMPEDKERIKTSGMNDFELKPFDPQQLKEKIKYYLSLNS